ncbi:L-histidine N(alpha)-methyltransferase [Fodinicola acaciae]|uniref:L-histidine N(alpha)-methyltransferase n=1 Tax=Fodinicola acaciae TaxID=2681555 RepID=UPI0013D1226E|nr:L-histidine N(alpha)-methyltransferase [Fodinicola acaciae]
MYVHGYSTYEARRLSDQADTLADLLHAGTRFPAGSRVLEVGCGVGAQTVHLVANSPGTDLVAIDVSADSLEKARSRVTGVEFRQVDLFALAAESFDHVFVCFVLEHLLDPVAALKAIRGVLRPGGTITVIEGDHDSAFFHPDSGYARAAVDCLVRLQAAGGGDGLIGRRLWPLLTDAGFDEVLVRPRTVYVDPSRPALVDGFTRNTFTAMIAAVRDDAIAAGLSTAADFDRGIADLRRTVEGTFHYTFFKGVAVNP